MDQLRDFLSDRRDSMKQQPRAFPSSPISPGWDSPFADDTPEKKSGWRDFRTVARLKKLWMEYSLLKGEKERIANFQVLLPMFCRSVGDSESEMFSEIFGDGIGFAFAVSRRFVTDSSIYLGSRFRRTDGNILEFFFGADLHIGKELLETLTILMIRKDLVGQAVECGLPCALIRTIESISLLSAIDLKTFLEQDSMHGKMLTEVIDLIAHTLRGMLTTREGVLALLKNDCFSVLIRMLVSEEMMGGFSVSRQSHDIVQCVFNSDHVDLEVANHIHKSKYVPQLVNAMETLQFKRFEHFVYITITCIRTISATLDLNAAILARFQDLRGYDIIPISFAKHLSLARKTDCSKETIEECLDWIAELTFIGKTIIEAPREPGEEDFEFIARPVSDGKRVRSLEGFLILPNLFSMIEDSHVQEIIVEKMLNIFAYCSSNYVAVHHTHSLTLILKLLGSGRLTAEVQEMVLKLLEYVVTGVNYVPFEELCTLVTVLHDSRSPMLMNRILQTIVKLVSFDPKFQEVFERTSLIHVLVDILRRFDSKVWMSRKSIDATLFLGEEFHCVLPLLVDALIAVLRNCPRCIQTFRDENGKEVIYDLIEDDAVRVYVLRVFQNLVVQDISHSERDIKTLIEVLQTFGLEQFELKRDVLIALKRMFLQSLHAKEVFKDQNGYVAVISVLVQLEGQFDRHDDFHDRLFSLVEAILHSLCASLVDSIENIAFFKKDVGFNVLGDAFRLAGALRAPERIKIFQFVLDVATERALRPACETKEIGGFRVPVSGRIVLADFIILMFSLVREVSVSLQHEIVDVMIYLAECGSHNLELLCEEGLTGVIFDMFDEDIKDQNSQHHTRILKLVTLLGSHRFSQQEMMKFLSYLKPQDSPLCILESALTIADKSATTPFVELSDGNTLNIERLGTSTWPPSSGFTFSVWISLNGNPAQLKPISIFQLSTSDKKSFVQFYLSQNGELVYRTSWKGHDTRMGSFELLPFTWHHIVLTHQYHRFLSSVSCVYVDGYLAGQKKVSYPSSTSNDIKGSLGWSAPTGGASSSRWWFGPCFLVEDVFSVQKVRNLFIAGPSYSGCLQKDVVVNTSEDMTVFPQNFIRHLMGRKSESTSQVFSDCEIQSFVVPEEKIIFAYNAFHSGLKNLPKGDGHSSVVVLCNMSASPDGFDPLAYLSHDADLCLPQSMGDAIQRVHGLTLVFQLVNLANDSNRLCVSLNLLEKMLRSDFVIKEMDRVSGYEVVLTFLKEKGDLITSKVCNAIFSIAFGGSSDGKEVFSNLKACRYWIFNNDIWKGTSIDIQQHMLLSVANALTNEFAELNCIRLRKIKAVPRLLHMFRLGMAETLHQDLVDVIECFLRISPDERDFRLVCGFMSSTMEGGISDVTVSTEDTPSPNSFLFLKKYAANEVLKEREVTFRNRMLRMLLGLIHKAPASCSALANVVKPPWIFTFLQGHTHPITISLILKLLVNLVIMKPSFASKLRSSGDFETLSFYLRPFCNQDEIYYSLFCLLLGETVSEGRHGGQIEFDNLFNKIEGSKVNMMFPEALDIIVSLILSLSSPETQVHFQAESSQDYFSELLCSEEPTLAIVGTSPRPRLLSKSSGKDRWALMKNIVLASSAFRSPRTKSSDDGSLIRQSSFRHTRRRSSIGSAEDTDSPRPRPPSLEKRRFEDNPDGAFSVSPISPPSPMESFRGAFERDQNGEQALIRFLLRCLRALHRNRKEFRTEMRKPETIEMIVTSLFESEISSLGPTRSRYSDTASIPSTPKRSPSQPSPRWSTGFVGSTSPVFPSPTISSVYEGTRRRAYTRFADDPMAPMPTSMTPVLPSQNAFNSSVSKATILLCLDIISRTMKSDRGLVLLEVFLDAYPPSSPIHIVNAFHTTIFRGIMGHIRNVVVNAEYFKSVSKASGSFAKFSNLLVERKLSRTIEISHIDIIDFIVFLILEMQGAEASGGASSHPSYLSYLTRSTGNISGAISLAYKGLNRMYLHVLGSILEGTDEAPIASLGTLSHHGAVAFSVSNQDDSFIYCLCHGLLNCVCQSDSHLQESAAKLWSMVYRSKEKLLTDLFRRSDGLDLVTNGFELVLGSDSSTFIKWTQENMGMIRIAYEPVVNKSWKNHEISSQKLVKDQSRNREAKLLEHRSRLEKRYQSQNAKVQRNIQTASGLIDGFVSEFAKRFRMIRKQDYFINRLAEEMWEKMVSTLYHDRGVWKERDDEAARWMLDPVEGPFRMRKKMTRNLEPPNPVAIYGPKYFESSSRSPLLETTGETGASKDEVTSQSSPEESSIAEEIGKKDMIHVRRVSQIPAELASTLPPLTIDFGGGDDKTPKDERLATESSREVEKLRVSTKEGNHDDDDDDDDDESSESSFSKSKVLEEDEEGAEEEEGVDFFDDEEAEYSKIRKLLQQNDKIEVIFNCSRIIGMDACTAIIVICTAHVYLIDNFCVLPESDGEIVEVEGTSEKASVVPTTTVPSGRGVQTLVPEVSLPHRDHQAEHTVRRWKYEEIREIYKRRHQLQPVAIELFFSDGENHLIVFHVSERDRAFAKFMSKDLTGLASSFGVTVDMFDETKKLRTLRKWMTGRWKKRNISNFEYLMFLNTLSGRTFNDIAQYPIFPWILRDYTSEKLDFSDASIFRDLSKPMGAQTPDRAEQFLLRYEEWESFDEPAFHYGSHYSSPGIVLYYLVRLEPFSSWNISLQSGRFDHADRLFHSIAETWKSASERNQSDVKELIPEFFYLPDFLENKNAYDFGVKQTGQKVSDVVLPPWAHGDSREFIRKHRQALESEYVSQHLHEWIDLIFGYKQLGKEAEKSLNVFHYMTYEGAIDIDKISDPVEREAKIGMINHFGQTPKQLFVHPHPSRGPPSKSFTVYSHPEILKIEDERRISGSVGCIQTSGEKLLCLLHKRVLVPPTFRKYMMMGFADRTLRLYSIDTEKMLDVYERLHTDQITCCEFSKDGSQLAVGGQDCVVSLWSVIHIKSSRKLELVTRLCGHLKPITCLYLSSTYNVMISGSQDLTCILWDMNRMSYVRDLTGYPCPPSVVLMNDITGDIFVAAGNHLFVYDVNGSPILRKTTSRFQSERILSMALSSGVENEEKNMVVTGHYDGSVRMWSIDHVQQEGGLGEFTLILRHMVHPHSFPVTALHITSSHHEIYSGDDQGIVKRFSLPEVGIYDHWIRDEEVDACASCKTRFSTLNRRHHCRNCGRVVCGSCSMYRIELPELHHLRPVRVCNDCYELQINLKAQQQMR
eukprot:TRINITY_DN5892_c0_g1_i1.p1 TRINITY_DN5892_c0_g1~~TRINITY_DN5892_c0_g1_i1.p1  ORF type:complete len:3232 (-),score=682.69 TRINITY_DN5892_c0_g1_i1:191-9886(-)